jgi:uncharacterized PurR-regulated membrane protein YhhQ (DUF165 family)
MSRSEFETKVFAREDVVIEKQRAQPREILAFVSYLSSIPFANLLIDHVGTVKFPGGPHVIPVGFGYEAPSGFLAIGFALVARDYVQQRFGYRASIFAIVMGVALSFLVNRDLAVASAVAFAFGEVSDLVVYTPIRRYSTFAAVLLSGVVGGVVDSLIFLQIAFGSTEFWQGQVIGKAWMALVGGTFMALLKHQRGSENVGVLA